MDKSRFYYSQFSCSYAVLRTTTATGYDFVTESGFIAPRIGYINRGNAVFSFDNFTLNAKEGDFIFIPKNLPYRSVWCGENGIDLFVVEIDADFLENKDIPAQIIHTPELEECFHNLYIKTREGSTLHAFCYFFNILKVGLERLTVNQKPRNRQTAPAVRFIEKNHTADFRTSELAYICNLSESRFFTVFRKETGYSPIDYKNLVRIKHALIYIKRDELSIDEICERLNFSSPAHFRKVLRKFTGKTPSQIKKEAEM